jgi:hypothetical protein
VDIIDEKTAWDILRHYAKDCREIDRRSLIAVFATGSLPGGYYRPGQSDIDAVLIVEDGSERIWGSTEEACKALKELNLYYLQKYQIPKDFGPFPLQKRDLFPPYNPGIDVLTLEIARLKLQGQAVYGQFDLGTVPMPTAEDFRAGARLFEQWCRDVFSKTTPREAMSTVACINTILMHLSRFLMIRRGIIEFNKRKLVCRYLDNDPPFVGAEAFRVIQRSLELRNIDEEDARVLRVYAAELQAKMNAYLGVAP